MTEQVSHGCRLHLETRHGWRVTTHYLMNQGWIPHPIADAGQLGCQQPLPRQPVATGTVDPEQLPPMVGIPLQFKAGSDVGILLCTVDHPDQENGASQRSEHHERRDQPSAGLLLFRCS